MRTLIIVAGVTATVLATGCMIGVQLPRANPDLRREWLEHRRNGRVIHDERFDDIYLDGTIPLDVEWRCLRTGSVDPIRVDARDLERALAQCERVRSSPCYCEPAR